MTKTCTCGADRARISKNDATRIANAFKEGAAYCTVAQDTWGQWSVYEKWHFPTKTGKDLVFSYNFNTQSYTVGTEDGRCIELGYWCSEHGFSDRPINEPCSCGKLNEEKHPSYKEVNTFIYKNYGNILDYGEKDD